MPHTLLLADDSVTIQRVIELTFAEEDVDVVAVGDGEQAIAALDRQPPDIVLADVGMPGRDGYEVAQHVKTTPRLAHIPVVLLTGAFEPIDQARATAVGCDGVLAKPFEPQLVIGRVKELLSRRPEAPAAQEAPAAREAATASPLESPQPPAPAVARPHRLVNDEYFEELDQAFATLGSSKTQGAERPAEPVAAPEAIDWFAQAVPYEAPPAPAPPPAAPPPVAAAPPAPAPRVYSEPAAAPAPVPVKPVQPAPAAAPPAFPPLADAFAALLAAEQTVPPGASAPVWPVAMPPEELIEQVTRRVLEQMSDRAVRETVAAIVAGVAERLIREEIDRIKKSLA